MTEPGTTDVGSDTGAPTEPVPPVGARFAPGIDGTAVRRPPTSADGHASYLRRGRSWLAEARRSRRRAALLGLALLVVAGALLAIVNPFTSPTTPTASRSYSVYTIKRQTLTSQTQVTADLGFSGSYSVTLPSGTSSQNIMQAQQAVTTDESKIQADQSGTTASADSANVAGDEQSLTAAQATLHTDESALQNDQSTLSADQKKEANDCAGTGSTGQTCATDKSNVSSDQQKVSSDEQKVTQDRNAVSQAQSKLSQDQARATQDAATAQRTLSSDEQKLANDQAALAAAEEQATIQSGAISQLPAVGQVVTQGQALYWMINTPVVLLYGTTPATRNLYQGEAGPDVAELNADLRTLGYPAPSGDTFTAATATAVDEFQGHLGVPQTGNLALGQVVFLPGAARITAVNAVLGADAQPGAAILSASSTAKLVTIKLDANLQADVKVGDAVTITLPNQQTTPGVVSYVGTVATVPSSGGNTHGTNSSAPTITVDVTPSDPSAIANFDQAPVSVSITNASARNALVVPVTALLALDGGGYALEVVPAHGTHYLVPVRTGLFDNAQGLVQVTGSQIHPGMRVVVPST
jgi:hypothetical protein